MRVLLLSTNREQSPFPVSPIGALSVSAAARAAGHDVGFLDLAFQAAPQAAIRRALRTSRWDVIGVSIRNLDNCFYSQPKSYYHEVKQCIDTIRQSSDAPVVLGGSGFSVEPEGWMTRLKADYGVVGEGERAFVALLERIGAGQPSDDIQGVVQADGEKNGTKPAEAFHDLDDFARPLHGQCRYRRYVRRGGYVSIQSKRGCPFKCIYCVYPQLEGEAYRLRSPEGVVEEIRAVVDSQGVREFFFVDSVFNSPREQAMAVCREIIRAEISVRWMACCNPVGFDGELAHAMARAGCIGVEFGLDAVTEKMISVLEKPFSQEEIAMSLKAAAAAKLPCAVHLLFGGPMETIEDVVRSREFLASCPTPKAVFASVGIRIYPRTALERIARSEGVLSSQADLFDPAYYVSTGLGDDPMRAVDTVARRRAEWSTATDWMRPIMRMIQRVVNRFGIRPQWRDIQNYGKHMRR